MIYIGIDPGLGGAIAFLDEETGEAKVFDTPTFYATSMHKKWRLHDLPKIKEIIEDNLCAETGDFARCHAVLEYATAIPKFGCVASFGMGRSLGIWEMTLTAFKIPFELVKPSIWKKKMMFGLPKGKKAAIWKAKSLFPTVDLSRVKDDGKAEALLLAVYLKRTT